MPGCTRWQVCRGCKFGHRGFLLQFVVVQWLTSMYLATATPSFRNSPNRRPKEAEPQPCLGRFAMRFGSFRKTSCMGLVTQRACTIVQARCVLLSLRPTVPYCQSTINHRQSTIVPSNHRTINHQLASQKLRNHAFRSSSISVWQGKLAFIPKPWPPDG